MNDRIFRHILLPAFAPILFLVIATTPVNVLGCRTWWATSALVLAIPAVLLILFA